MKTIKIIDLLNKIANGEEVPSKIEYRNIKFLYDKNNKLYTVENYNEYNDLLMELSNHKGTDLNYEVEIIPIQEEIVEYTNKFLEVWKPINKQLGKFFDELLRIKNDLELNLEDEIDEKKIPEKLEILNANDHSKEIYYENYSKEEISLDIETLQVWVNKIIDYLKSKEDE